MKGPILIQAIVSSHLTISVSVSIICRKQAGNEENAVSWGGETTFFRYLQLMMRLLHGLPPRNTPEYAHQSNVSRDQQLLLAFLPQGWLGARAG